MNTIVYAAAWATARLVHTERTRPTCKEQLEQHLDSRNRQVAIFDAMIAFWQKYIKTA